MLITIDVTIDSCGDLKARARARELGVRYLSLLSLSRLSSLSCASFFCAELVAARLLFSNAVGLHLNAVTIFPSVGVDYCILLHIITRCHY